MEGTWTLFSPLLPAMAMARCRRPHPPPPSRDLSALIRANAPCELSALEQAGPGGELAAGWQSRAAWQPGIESHQHAWHPTPLSAQDASLQPLASLHELRTLELADNNLSALGTEGVEGVVEGMPALLQIDLKGCPGECLIGCHTGRFIGGACSPCCTPSTGPRGQAPMCAQGSAQGAGMQLIAATTRGGGLGSVYPPTIFPPTPLLRPSPLVPPPPLAAGPSHVQQPTCPPHPLSSLPSPPRFAVTRQIKYREAMIMMSDSLRSIDGNEVLQSQREFLLRLHVSAASLHEGLGSLGSGHTPSHAGCVCVCVCACCGCLCLGLSIVGRGACLHA